MEAIADPPANDRVRAEVRYDDFARALVAASSACARRRSRSAC